MAANRSRIHFVSHSFAPEDEPLANVGGMQRVATELAAALGERADVDLELLVLRAPWSRIHLHAPPFFVALGPRLLARTRPGDRVLFASVTTALGALPFFDALRARSVRLCAIAHGLDVTQPHTLHQKLVRATLAGLDSVLPVSRSTADECELRGARAVEVVPNGVDLARFARVAAAREWSRRPLARAKEPSAPFVLLGVGRQVRRKGFVWFVDQVMPKLPERFRLVLVGDGPERAQLERTIAEHRLESRVHLAGLAPEAELLGWYERADAFVMPNVVVPGDVEGFGIVLLEAAATGLPAVVARLEGMTDVVRDGVTGSLLPPEHPEAWVAELIALADDEERRLAMGVSAKRHASASHGWPAMAARYLDALGVSRGEPPVQRSTDDRCVLDEDGLDRLGHRIRHAR